MAGSRLSVRANRYTVPGKPIFSEQVDRTLNHLGLHVLKVPVRQPTANAHVERVVGTIRRELTDHVIILSERHLHRILKEWTAYYNHAKPHMSLGPGIPVPLPENTRPPPSGHRHQLPDGYEVVKRPVLGGLHHEYALKKVA